MTSFSQPSLQSDSSNSKMIPVSSASSLMSPPETKPFESFNPAMTPHAAAQDSPASSDIKLPPISADRKRTQSEMDLPSPPVTPYTGHKKRRSNASEQIESHDIAARDPPLFGRHDSAAPLATDEPLFGPVAPAATDTVFDQHIKNHMSLFKNKWNKPTHDEYHLALSCIPVVSTNFNRDPVAWFKQERETLERQMAMMDRPYAASSAKKQILPKPGPKKAPNVPPRVPRPGRAKRTPRSTPKQKAHDSFDATPASAHKAPRALGTNRDDTDYNSIPDFSPPLDTLGANAKALKADWKGQMLDLSGDPDRHLLVPAEVNLAATLRLSCATYLCSKRRIFEARVKALKVGKEFRKTDAQQACKIDVNKASKLWTAYDRVGWFNRVYFQKYLKDVD